MNRLCHVVRTYSTWKEAEITQMNDQIGFLNTIAARLDSVGIPYMLTGSVAMSCYAEPRMTRDIDIVIQCNANSPAEIVRLFQEDCYISPEAVEDAVVHQKMFNIIHLKSIMKADFIVRKDNDFRRLEFERRNTVNIAGTDFSVVTVEDLFLSKLQWWKESDSGLQLADLELLKAQVVTMDWDYVSKWANHLHLGPWLKKLEK